MRKGSFSLERKEYYKACRDAKMALLNAVANPSLDAEIALQEHRFIIARLLNIVNGGTSLTAKTVDRVMSAMAGFLVAAISLLAIVLAEPLRGIYVALCHLTGSEIVAVLGFLIVITAVSGCAIEKLYVLTLMKSERKRLSNLLERIDDEWVGGYLKEFYAQAVSDARDVVLASRSYSSPNMEAKLRNHRNQIAYLLNAVNGGASLDYSSMTYGQNAIYAMRAVMVYAAILNEMGFFDAHPEPFKSEWVWGIVFVIATFAISAIITAILGTLTTATIRSFRRQTLSNLLKQIDDELTRYH